MLLYILFIFGRWNENNWKALVNAFPNRFDCLYRLRCRVPLRRKLSWGTHAFNQNSPQKENICFDCNWKICPYAIHAMEWMCPHCDWQKLSTNTSPLVPKLTVFLRAHTIFPRSRTSQHSISTTDDDSIIFSRMQFEWWDSVYVCVCASECVCMWLPTFLNERCVRPHLISVLV